MWVYKKIGVDNDTLTTLFKYTTFFFLKFRLLYDMIKILFFLYHKLEVVNVSFLFKKEIFFSNLKQL